MKKEFLMGKTTSNNLIFANVEIRKDVFSVSFNEVSPIEVTDEYLKEIVDYRLEDMDDSSKLQLLEEYDCPYSELLDEYLSQSLIYNGVEDLIDISLYPESYDIGGYETIYFESEGCGQLDTRDELIPINDDFSNYLHDMWDKFHLKEVQKDMIEELKVKIGRYENSFSETEWVENFLKTVYR